MLLDLDVADRKVVIFGSLAASRRVIKRFVAAGARVTVVAEEPTVGRPDQVRVLAQPAADDLPSLLRLVGPAWLVVVVGPASPVRQRVRELCRHLKIVCTTERAATADGQVLLVGGGPGTGRLLTVEARDALREADVVFYDRLGPRDDLARLAPAAELVDVGKGPFHHPTSQSDIQRLMVVRALAGDLVVRLKGGDPFVFGRGGEEMLACLESGVPVRVVPGVSSAIAVPAAAGIPVTHRGTSHAFTVISGHVPPNGEELSALVRLGGTIVILMGITNLVQIAAGLLAAGIEPTTPVAVVERGFSDSQRTTHATVESLPVEARRVDIRSPAVVVIGAVARLSFDQSGAAALVSAMGSLTPPPTGTDPATRTT